MPRTNKLSSLLATSQTLLLTFLYLILSYSPTMHTRCTRARNEAEAVAVNADSSQPSADTVPPVKQKRNTKPKPTAASLAADNDTAAQAECIVNQQLANLEATHSCDENLPTPHPLSETRSTSTLSCSTSQKDIAALIAEH